MGVSVLAANRLSVMLFPTKFHLVKGEIFRKKEKKTKKFKEFDHGLTFSRWPNIFKTSAILEFREFQWFFMVLVGFSAFSKLKPGNSRKKFGHGLTFSRWPNFCKTSAIMKFCEFLWVFMVSKHGLNSASLQNLVPRDFLFQMWQGYRIWIAIGIQYFSGLSIGLSTFFNSTQLFRNNKNGIVPKFLKWVKSIDLLIY